MFGGRHVSRFEVIGLRDGFWDMFVGLAGPEDLAHGRRNELTRRDTQPKEEERIPVYGVREELKGSNAVEVFDIEKQPIVREEARVTKTPGEESPATTTVQPEDVREQKQDPSFESREVSKTIMK